LYFELLKKLAIMDRCHCGPEMESAYKQLVDHFPGARLLSYGDRNEVNNWLRPPYWYCKHAELSDEEGNIITSRDHHNLAVFSFSPSVDKTISLAELQDHLFSDPDRPDAICFHFRNQYRHWATEWGFAIPHMVRAGLSDSVRYHVHIDSGFDFSREMIQSDYHHQGQSDDTYLFVGHFDHPSQVNDGLAGCVAAYEIIRRLQGRKTRFSYRALASVEIVGSVYYLDKLGDQVRNLRESLFLGFSGIDSPLVYQQSFWGKSLIDRIAQFLLSFYNSDELQVYGHRELIGNDENVFDSVGYEIPSGTLMRWPFPQYHTDFDSMEITSRENLEEVIDFVLHVVDVIENNYYLNANYAGLPSLANPDVDLYLSLGMVSGVDDSSSWDMDQYQSNLPVHEFEHLNSSWNLNRFMQNIVRLADGKHTILDIAELSRIPFGFALKYASLMKERGLISFSEVPV
jgi:aminopeptidase-like protein